MKKLGALIVSLALVLTAILGNGTVVNAADTLDDGTIELVALDSEGTEVSEAPLEIGDVLTIGIKAASDVEDVQSIEGDLYYDEENFEALNISNEISESGWGRGWDTEKNRLKITAEYDKKNETPASILTASGQLITLQLKVKKAVNADTAVRFENIKVNVNGTPYTIVNAATATITNSKAADRGFEVAVENVSVPVGRSVKVPISAVKNTGFSSLGLKVTYTSPKRIKCTNVEMSSKLKAYAECWAHYDDVAGEVTIGVVNSEKDITVTGDLFELEFTADDTALEGESIVVRVEVTDVDNVSETDMAGTGSDTVGTISITKAVEKGDVNMDGSITLVDATYLLQYYNGIRTFNVIQEEVGDVDGSGKITLTDVLKILKYYNGEISSFT